jgi:hypothetical protein
LTPIQTTTDVAEMPKDEETMLPANHADRREKIPARKIIRVNSRDSRVDPVFLSYWCLFVLIRVLLLVRWHFG